MCSGFAVLLAVDEQEECARQVPAPPLASEMTEN